MKLRNSESVSQPCKIILSKLARWCQQLFTLIFLCIISICITIVLTATQVGIPLCLAFYK